MPPEPPAEDAIPLNEAEARVTNEELDHNLTHTGAQLAEQVMMYLRARLKRCNAELYALGEELPQQLAGHYREALLQQLGTAAPQMSHLTALTKLDFVAMMTQAQGLVLRGYLSALVERVLPDLEDPTQWGPRHVTVSTPSRQVHLPTDNLPFGLRQVLALLAAPTLATDDRKQLVAGLAHGLAVARQRALTAQLLRHPYPSSAEYDRLGQEAQIFAAQQSEYATEHYPEWITQRIEAVPHPDEPKA